MMLVGLLAFMVSCSKDKDMPSPKGSTSPVKTTRAAFRSDITNWSQCTESVDLACGSFLTFRDENHFFDVYDCLERAYNHWNDSIDNAYSSYTDDDYNDLWEANGWDEDQQLVNFENFYAHQSKRKALFDMEELWLTDPDAHPDPDDYDIFEDYIMNTLWSSNMNIKIGSNLIHIFPNGRILIVDNADCQLFFSFIADSNQIHPNARLWGPVHTNPDVDAIPDCWEGGVQRNYRTSANPAKHSYFSFDSKPYANRFKISAREYNLIAFRWYALNAEVKVYRGRNNGWGYKKYKTTINELGVDGELHNDSCMLLGTSGITADRVRRHKHKATVRTTNLTSSLFIKDNGVVGDFKLPGLANYTETLRITR
jgi:hypothetical protein